MMTVSISRDVNLAGAMADGLLAQEDDQRVEKDWFNPNILDGWH